MTSSIPSTPAVMAIDIHAGAERLRANLNFANRGNPAQIMILHGAGRGDRLRSEYLAQEMARRGRSTIRFDFSGHGESTGTLQESSLRKRLEEALAVSALLDQTRPVTVIGNSMGGFIAARLSRHISIDHLVLMCPAAYAADAEDVTFGPDFTARLNRPYSYRSSRTFEDVRDFPGRVSIVIGSKDDVIPDDIITLYREAAAAADRPYDFLLLEGAPHLLHPWLEQNRGDRVRFLNLFRLESRQARTG